ncbi:MAG: DUF2946 family protein [Pseudomonadota bacterium]
MIRKTSSFRFLRTRPAIPLLALLALFFGAWTPQGFMPMQTEQGFAIVLCSDYGPESPMNGELFADHANSMDHSEHGAGHGEHGSSESENSTCTYAGSSNSGLDTTPVKTPSVATPAPQYMSHARHRFAVRNRINIPPATGPPDFV